MGRVRSDLRLRGVVRSVMFECHLAAVYSGGLMRLCLVPAAVSVSGCVSRNVPRCHISQTSGSRPTPVV